MTYFHYCHLENSVKTMYISEAFEVALISSSLAKCSFRYYWMGKKEITGNIYIKITLYKMLVKSVNLSI